MDEIAEFSNKALCILQGNVHNCRWTKGLPTWHRREDEEVHFYWKLTRCLSCMGVGMVFTVWVLVGREYCKREIGFDAI